MGKYNDKRNDSFKTRYKLFLFEMAFKRITPKELVSKEDIANDFETFEITKDIIDAYAANYYQKEYDQFIEYKDFGKLTVDKIYESMYFEENNLFQLVEYKHRKNISSEYLYFYNKLKESYVEIFEKSFPEKAFLDMRKKQNCEYCGVSIEDIEYLGEHGQLYNKRSETRGYTLEIDRKEANKEYTEDNCCMSCYWCNNAKTDEFNVSEFKEIAYGINQAWNKRLDGKRKIVFPET